MYFNIQRCASFVSLQRKKWFHRCQRKKDFTGVQGEFCFHFPSEWISWSFDLKNCSEYTSTPFNLKAWTVCVHLCIYVHSDHHQQKPAYNGLRLANSNESEAHRLGRGLSTRLRQFHRCQGPALGASSMQTLPSWIIFRARSAETAPLQLWLVSRLGFVVGVAVQVSEQWFAIGKSISRQ